MDFHPTLVTEGFQKSRFQTIPYKNTFWTFSRSQKCPNSNFFHESLVESVLRGKGTYLLWLWNIFLLNFKEGLMSYDSKCKRSKDMKTKLWRRRILWIVWNDSFQHAELVVEKQRFLSFFCFVFVVGTVFWKYFVKRLVPTYWTGCRKTAFSELVVGTMLYRARFVRACREVYF